MYSLRNKKDIPYILKYHRAKDMVNIMTFFPGLSPVDDLAVILDEEDYLNNRDKIALLTSVRNGNPINELCMKSIPEKYSTIKDFIWLDIIKNIIKPLEKNEDLLRSCDFLEINLSGHTEGVRFMPWQMVDDKRM